MIGHAELRAAGYEDMHADDNHNFADTTRRTWWKRDGKRTIFAIRFEMDDSRNPAIWLFKMNHETNFDDGMRTYKLITQDPNLQVIEDEMNLVHRLWDTMEEVRLQHG